MAGRHPGGDRARLADRRLAGRGRLLSRIGVCSADRILAPGHDFGLPLRRRGHYLLGGGGLLGVLASQSDQVSAFLRPINDTLQTIPLFVFLIPVLMVFQHGDFAAVLAIVMYAIVPAIRYTEHGIRNVPADIVEAARASGCTRGQLLRLVQLPLALPEIMLGLNQVVVFALAMLIVTALLGTQDLGQKIYQALARSELGNGIVAGLCIAFIAMIADRIIQALSARWKANLGLQ